MHTDLQLLRIPFTVGRTALNRIQNFGEVVAQKDGNNGRRGLVSAKPVIVSCAGYGDAQQVLVLVHRFDDGGEKE